ncbi:hypothetical protein BC343_17270 [Mucilaginibacter pedocola]|uniref:Uncharacterized protein n=2 Tax=Mucilaginibacter pedocola TaxID=1792845 RepID=A0A1S9P709_9SPHI|nr:hypothetical protein BC343_17270 [Mucilaginibacter pedocola]
MEHGQIPGGDKVRELLIKKLGKVYMVQTNLEAALPRLARQSHLPGAKKAIAKTARYIRQQLGGIILMLAILGGSTFADNDQNPATFYADDTETSITPTDDTPDDDMKNISRLYMAASVSAASYRSMQIVTKSFGVADIESLLKDNLKEAESDKEQLLEALIRYL